MSRGVVVVNDKINEKSIRKTLDLSNNANQMFAQCFLKALILLMLRTRPLKRMIKCIQNLKSFVLI